MSQESSLTQSAHSVRQVLTAYTPEALTACSGARYPEPPQAPITDSLALPLEALSRARSETGIGVARALETQTRLLGGRYFHFGMDEAVHAPLGWTLSATARCEIEGLLKREPIQSQMEELQKLLGRSEPRK
jgi:hypothetical protein